MHLSGPFAVVQCLFVAALELVLRQAGALAPVVGAEADRVKPDACWWTPVPSIAEIVHDACGLGVRVYYQSGSSPRGAWIEPNIIRIERFDRVRALLGPEASASIRDALRDETTSCSD